MVHLKKYGALLLLGCIAASLAGCGGGGTKPADGTQSPGKDAASGPADLTITSSGATDEAVFEKNYRH
ncbi:hypothetical protein O9H85_20050 [Paenibacillus filicis]|uniref:Uncharacterized protein n=1 Tax=Paenibacillus gyeongsangnamensis TaxID=3388067 RepID=A0ABT4QCT2_9BACL|nr:hypothetical protein [Paenibacillus filicis]MCZ8514676.1 hypothetical protein [Paenibacillus filicis]